MSPRISDVENFHEPQVARIYDVPHAPQMGTNTPTTRMLLADDDAEIRRILENLLHDAARELKAVLEIDVASDGAEAIRIFDPTRHAYALLDLDMPGKDGFGVARHIHRLTGGETRVIIVTNDRNSETTHIASELIERGIFTGIHQTPKDFDALQAIVKAELSKALSNLAL